MLHIWALHIPGNNNPTGIDVKSPREAIPFHPYYTIKDGFALALFALFFAGFVFYAPNYLGHPDNYIPADPLQTPAHIVPEWYFLPFYAILRAIPSKLFGVAATDRLDRRSCSSCPGSTPRGCARRATGRSTNGSSGRTW